MRRAPKGPVDWASVRARLAAAAEDLRATPEGHRRTLEERARRLAARPAAPEPGERCEVLIVGLGDERLALETRCVREVAAKTTTLPVPGTPPIVAGVTGVRGRIVPVFDLGVLLGRARAARTQLVILGGDTDVFALAVDRLDEVRVVSLATLQPVPGPAEPLVRGALSDALVVLGVDALLADARLHVRITP